jgi:non-ribosomal peptide synthase protein (TIGR01720 family)
MQNKYKLTFADRIVQKTPFTFDVSVWELFWPLLVGSTEIISSPHDHKDPNLLLKLIGKEKISVCHFVPSMLEGFLDTAAHQNQHSLRLTITSGEILSHELAKKYYLKMEAPLHNLYGPTETSIDVTCYECSRDTGVTTVPIGTPISNTQIYILDTQMNPVPVGVSGEIYIGGVGLARGYLNRPDLTAERFIPNPFVNEKEIVSEQGCSITEQCPSLRLYRTGDLARYLPDGNIEFLGRIDDQVKIRGFRIELGEIESTLTTLHNVAQTVVIAREDEPGDKKLVAYIVPHEDIFISLSSESTFTSSSGDSFSVLNGDIIPTLTEDLRNHLARSLPDYMIPSFFVYLDQIPLTPNGKVDRKSLPTPDLTLRQLGDIYVAPQTVVEQELSSIWGEVLKIEKIGVHDNFFRIGGDSIISIQMVSKARSRGIHFAVKDVFTHPTIAALASVAKTQVNDITFKPDQEVIVGDVPFTPIQHWFFNSNLIEPNHFNQTTLLLTRVNLDLSLLNQTFSLLISHHDALRLRYTLDNHNHWKQKSLASEDTPTCIQIDLSSSQDLSFDIERESSLAQQSLDIKNGPVIKAILFNCGPSRPQRLLIVIHHLMVDGVSWRILTEDLERLYSQLAKGETPILLPKTHSYQQWANALNEYSTSQTLQKEIPYWQKIENCTEALPIDFNHGPPSATVVRTVGVSLTKDETTLLLQRVPKAYRTQINDILLTALVLAIGDWTEKYTLTLTLEGHGREDIIKDIDLSRTVGWFTSIFPVHLNIDNPHDLAEAIKTVKETLREIPHKGIGYGVLSHLTQETSLSSSTDSHFSHPTLNFNYLGQWDNTTSQEELFTFAQESPGQAVSDKNNLSHLLNINSEVKGNVLHLFWTYSSNHYTQETIEKISHFFITRLKQLIQHCCQDNNFGYTPSDFKLAKLEEINNINQIINKK